MQIAKLAHYYRRFIIIIHRVTAVTHEGQAEELGELMKTEARALFRISRICTIVDPEEGLAHGLQEAQHLQRFGLQLSEFDTEADRALEAAIHPSIIGAIHLEEDAFLTPHLFVQGLAHAAGSKGAVLLPQTEVLNFNLQKDRISRARRPSNLLIGTGYSTLGLSLGPITGQLLVELVLGKQPSLPLHLFRNERFS